MSSDVCFHEMQSSAKDRKKGIVIPCSLDTDLAELVGIIVGDGHLRVRGYEHGVYISGHSEDDAEYFRGRITDLFRMLFNVKHSLIQNRKGTNELKFVVYSKAVTLFLKEEFVIPSNKSLTIGVPSRIFDSDIEIKKSFLRGLADTDFSMTFKRKYRKNHYYPVIHASFASKRLTDDSSTLLSQLGFKHYLSKTFAMDKRRNRPQTSFHIFISGKDNFNRWFREIGSSNPKHLRKFKIWKMFGFYPPRLTHNERVAMLEEDKVGRARFELATS